MGRDFDALISEVKPRLARAFIAAYGPERGEEALSEALAFAWEHRDRVAGLENPAGYLFRVGQSRTRPRLATPLFPPPADAGVPWVEPRLPEALTRLTEHQRVCVVLARGYGWTYPEIAALLDVQPTTVQNHVQRALSSMRACLEVVDDAAH